MIINLLLIFILISFSWLHQWGHRWKSPSAVHKIQFKFFGFAHHKGLEALVSPKAGNHIIPSIACNIFIFLPNGKLQLMRNAGEWLVSRVRGTDICNVQRGWSRGAGLQAKRLTRVLLFFSQRTRSSICSLRKPQVNKTKKEESSI